MCKGGGDASRGTGMPDQPEEDVQRQVPWRCLSKGSRQAFFRNTPPGARAIVQQVAGGGGGNGICLAHSQHGFNPRQPTESRVLQGVTSECKARSNPENTGCDPQTKMHP